MKIFYSLTFLLVATCSFGQKKSLSELEKEVEKNNDALKYQNSIKLLTDFISREDISDYDRYFAYLLKSYTYKRVFNYELTLDNLELGLKEGVKSDKKQLVIQTVNAQKAFCYFDTHEYEKAGLLMKELEKSNYAYLDPQDKSFIIMQEGYLLMLKKEYLAAEIKLDSALQITEKCCARNLPNIYGKKMELYNLMKLYEKRDFAFRAGMNYAKQYNIIKYELYLYEVLKKCYQYNEDCVNALETYKKYDSIFQIYNANSYNGKITILENKLESERRLFESKKQSIIISFMAALIFLLLVLLGISIKLYFTIKQKKQLLLEENRLMQDKITSLLNEVDSTGKYSFNFSTYKLSERQKEIIQLIREGRSNKDIANTLSISENTVKFHVKNIYSLLNINHRSDLK